MKIVTDIFKVLAMLAMLALVVSLFIFLAYSLITSFDGLVTDIGHVQYVENKCLSLGYESSRVTARDDYCTTLREGTMVVVPLSEAIGEGR